ncbi:MAG TPA: isochorismate synthase [Anaerolineales bacterium]|nr:isochorismate synthase [Anaerolineales bacterium]
MPNPNRFSETRQRILSAAIAVFSRKGYHDAKVDEIVEESQTSKGSVYFHFPSKEKIFLALVDEITEKLTARLMSAVQAETSGVQKVRAALRTCLDTFSQYRALAKIVLVQSMGAGNLFVKKRQEVYGHFASIIQIYLEQGMADGDIPPLDAEVTAIAWLGAINELVVRWVTTDQPDLQRALPALEAMLLRSVGVLAPFPVPAPITEASAQVIAFHLPLPTIDFLACLRRFPQLPKCYLAHDSADPTERFVMVGFGELTRITAEGHGRFQQIRQQVEAFLSNAINLSERDMSYPSPRLIGGLSFAPHTAHGIWQDFPSALFTLPAFCLTQENNHTWLTVHALQSADQPISREHLRQQALSLSQQIAQASQAGVPLPSQNYAQWQSSQTRAEWDSQVQAIRQQISKGHIQKAVLARVGKLTAERDFDTVRALQNLQNRYPACYRFLFSFSPESAFLGATPELLCRVQGDELFTEALAGSIGRGADATEDQELATQLLTSSKDQHEHAFVVDSIRRRLKGYVESLTFAKQPQLRKLNNIQHLHTPIRARLAPHIHLLDILAELHPTPAVGGTPREQALPLILQIEPQARGWYAAPVGWLDGQGNGQFFVAIRSAVVQRNQATLFAGAGIVADSDPQREWNETELKFQPMRTALQAM